MQNVIIGKPLVYPSKPFRGVAPEHKFRTKETGFILWEDQFKVVIITGFQDSANDKTGPMLQTWILVKSENPMAAVKSGQDVHICGLCPHRGAACYVDKSKAPYAVWEKYNRGGYKYLTDWRILADWNIRFGAYGDPFFAPLSLWQRLALASAGHTGYTHQWKSPFAQGLKGLVMASCDTLEEKLLAESMGWRVFRVRTENEPLQANEVSCPASDEMGNRTQCDRCLLCSGTKRNGRDWKPKSVGIIVHGTYKTQFRKPRKIKAMALAA
jgi:hypothetical protein